MKIFLIILIVLICLTAAAGFFLASFSMTGKRQTLEEAREWQEAHYDLSWYDNLEKEDYTVSGFENYELHVQMLRNPVPTDRYILISHGYTDNRIGSLKYAGMYLDLGFHVIIYDLRGHGQNEPDFCTYSVRESRDLDALIRDSRERYPEMTVFGIHGESLGAASSVACLQFHPRIDFVVADCGFSEITSVLKGGLKSMHLPAGLVHAASVCAKIRYGYSFGEMRPVDALQDNEIPILFLHGGKDTFILPSHSEIMQRATKGYSELHLIPEAGHAMSVLTDPESYRADVEAFLQKIL